MIDYNEPVGRAFTELFDRQVYHLQNTIRDNGAEPEHENGSYPFIRNSSDYIMLRFIQIRKKLNEMEKWRNKYQRPEGVNFLDAGCGIGNILVLALQSCLCQDATGFEYFPETLKLGRKFLKTFGPYISKKARIKKVDILKSRKYGDYDIIYFYCPFADSEKEKLFEEKIRNQMKVGSIIIPYGTGNTHHDKRFESTKLHKHGQFLFYTKIKE